jgi:hypothetical protein
MHRKYYDYTCSGTGCVVASSNYVGDQVVETCSFGCSNGICNQDPCANVDVSDQCDGDILKTNGVCVDGVATFDETFCDYGCESAECKTNPCEQTIYANIILKNGFKETSKEVKIIISPKIDPINISVELKPDPVYSDENITAEWSSDGIKNYKWYVDGALVKEGVSQGDTLTIDELSDSSKEGNLTWIEQGTKTKYIELPCDADVVAATIDLEGKAIQRRHWIDDFSRTVGGGAIGNGWVEDTHPAGSCYGISYDAGDIDIVNTQLHLSVDSLGPTTQECCCWGTSIEREFDDLMSSFSFGLDSWTQNQGAYHEYLNVYAYWYYPDGSLAGTHETKYRRPSPGTYDVDYKELIPAGAATSKVKLELRDAQATGEEVSCVIDYIKVGFGDYPTNPLLEVGDIDGIKEYGIVEFRTDADSSYPLDSWMVLDVERDGILHGYEIDNKDPYHRPEKPLWGRDVHDLYDIYIYDTEHLHTINFVDKNCPTGTNNACDGITWAGPFSPSGSDFTKHAKSPYNENNQEIYGYRLEVADQTDDFSSAINDYLSSLSANPNETCQVPLEFSSETMGIIKYSNIKIDYAAGSVYGTTLGEENFDGGDNISIEVLTDSGTVVGTASIIALTSPCENVVCSNYCDGFTYYSNGVCNEGDCIHEEKPNATECNWTEPICYVNEACGEDGFAEPYCDGNQSIKEFMQWECKNPGIPTAECVQNKIFTIKEDCDDVCYDGLCVSFECKSDVDCGESRFLNNLSCNGNEVWDIYRNYTCDNPSTINASCSYSDEYQSREVCDDVCEEAECRDVECWEDLDCGTDEYIGGLYCSADKDVVQIYRTYECLNKGTGAADCTSSEEEIVKKSCRFGCFQGECEGVTCYLNSECGEDEWVRDKYCQDGDIWQDYLIYRCREKGTDYSHCDSYEEGRIRRGCDNGCSNGVCLSADFACSTNTDCGKDGLIGSLYCSSGDVWQRHRTWTCHNAGTHDAYCSYDDDKELIEDCAEECVNGKCVADVCNIDSDCGINYWIGVPYCEGDDVYQIYRIWSCDVPGTDSCSYSDSVHLKENCAVSCLNAVCVDDDGGSDSDVDLEVKYFIVQNPGVTAGNPAVLAFNLQNTGQAPVDEAEWRLNTGSGVIINGVVTGLKAGEGQIIARKISYSNAGTYYASVKVDPKGNIDEFNEENNQEELVVVIG